MADGFEVDLGALRRAAEGVADTLAAMATRKVSDIDASVDAFGHEDLGRLSATSAIDGTSEWGISPRTVERSWTGCSGPHLPTKRLIGTRARTSLES